jgi:hypothetical protein
VIGNLRLASKVAPSTSRSAQLIAPSNLTTSDINIFLHATYPIHWRMPSDWLPLWQSGGNVTTHRQKEGDDDGWLQYIVVRRTPLSRCTVRNPQICETAKHLFLDST